MTDTPTVPPNPTATWVIRAMSALIVAILAAFGIARVVVAYGPTDEPAHVPAPEAAPVVAPPAAPVEATPAPAVGPAPAVL